MSTLWQNISIVLTNNTVVTTTYTGGVGNDYQSIANYVQQNAHNGFWIGNTYYSAPFISIAIS